MTKLKRPKIGLALGSGGPRGLAHIGVIKVLEESNIPIDFIAGSSIGAMIGGFYAAGLSVKEIEEISSNTDWRRLLSVFFDPHLKHGLISGEKVKKFIEGNLDEKKFEDCKIPFAATATDIKTGETVVLDKGEMAPAIRASISIPLIFKPAKIGGRTLIDGGISVPVPVEIVRSMGADLVIAVNLYERYRDENWKSGWYDIANDSLNIMFHHLALSNVATADVVIDIGIGKSSWYQFANGQDKILDGERAAREVLPQLKKLARQENKSDSRSCMDKFLDFLKS